MYRANPVLASAIALALAAQASGAFAAGPADRALALLQAQPKAVHASVADRFHSRDVIVDADGTEHVRLDRSFGGLPVIGGDVVLHSRDGALRSVSMTLRGELSLATRAKLPAAEAIERAGAVLRGELSTLPQSTLVVYARGATPRLAWQVRIESTGEDGNPADDTVIVDATDGRVLDRWSNHETILGRGGSTTACTGTAATGSGRTLYSGNVAIGTTNCGNSLFHAKDMGRGNGTTIDLNNRSSGGSILADADNTWGNNNVSDRASAGADAHFGVATTWDYFKLVHGRNGIANDGKGATSRVHYGRNYSNAFWSDSCFCMSFGDGNGTTYSPLVSLDIAGHEMSHGVTSRSANLVYSGESGGLNEATSDIFGTMVEFYAGNANDAGDYLIGEKIYIAGNKALRYMYKPSTDGASADCWSSTVGQKDVHYSSGVANHFFYLLAEGSAAKVINGTTVSSPTCNGAAVTGIGRAKAEKIWYRALTVYMTSNTSYAAARTATINAANDLHGAGSAEATAVAAAWTAVSVN